MRRVVARRLHAQAREIHSRPGRQVENKLMGQRVTRKANNLARLRWARFRQIQHLLGTGMTPVIAETMVPAVATESVIAVMTGPRATYQFLKKLHREQRKGQQS